MQNPYTDAVIEKSGENNYSVTLHPDAGAAEKYAAEIASENTAYTKKEIEQNLRARSSHEEGDYGVFLATAIQKADKAAKTPKPPKTLLQTCGFIPISGLVPKAWASWFYCAISENAPFSWGDNNRSLLTDSALAQH